MLKLTANGSTPSSRPVEAIDLLRARHSTTTSSASQEPGQARRAVVLHVDAPGGVTARTPRPFGGLLVLRGHRAWKTTPGTATPSTPMRTLRTRPPLRQPVPALRTALARAGMTLVRQETAVSPPTGESRPDIRRVGGAARNFTVAVRYPGWAPRRAGCGCPRQRRTRRHAAAQTAPGQYAEVTRESGNSGDVLTVRPAPCGCAPSRCRDTEDYRRHLSTARCSWPATWATTGTWTTGAISSTRCLPEQR